MEAADATAGVIVQVVVQGCQGSRAVPMESQRGFHRLDQAAPLVVVGELAGFDQNAASGDLLAADAGEQGRRIDPDPPSFT